jgi:rhodanese-related sulfurtransferase
MKKILLSIGLVTAIFASEDINTTMETTQLKGCGKDLVCKTLSCKYLEDANKIIHSIEPKDLNQMILKNEDFVLVDLRDSKQFERGQIDYKNLHNIDRGYLEFKIEDVAKDKNTKIVLYCCTGKRSALSAKVLEEMGYTNVMSLSGGISDWVDQRFPLLTQYGIMKLTDN